jgi:hypothetical protein
MNLIYDSTSYCIVEFRDAAGHIGGYEVTDKLGRRGMYLGGDLAARFQAGVQRLIEDEPSTDDIDEYLSGFEGLMQTPVALH